MDKTIKIWDAKNFKLLKVIDKSRHGGHLTAVNKIFWSNYKNRLISCSDDRSISIWELKFNPLP
jgi:WD40 repeat protein